MSNWTVKYRTREGSLQKEVVSASSRSDVIGILRNRGLTPIEVAEGGSVSVSGRPSLGINLKWLAVTVSLLLVIMGTWSIYSIIGKRKPEASQDPVQKVERKTAATKKAVKDVPHSTVGTKSQELMNSKVKIDSEKKDQPPTKHLTPEDEGYVSPDPGFAERYKKFKEQQASLVFKNISEFEIHRIISTQPGETILATSLHPAFEKDFVEHLDDQILINDDDSEETKQDKRNMIEVKRRLKELMDKGMSVREVLMQEQEHLQKVATLRDNLYGELKSIEKTAKSTQEIDDFVAAANKMLEEYGAKHIKLPISADRLRLLKSEGRIK